MKRVLLVLLVFACDADLEYGDGERPDHLRSVACVDSSGCTCVVYNNCATQTSVITCEYDHEWGEGEGEPNSFTGCEITYTNWACP
jgi:hypothetical protein